MGNNSPKGELIPHNTIGRHLLIVKDFAPPTSGRQFNATEKILLGKRIFSQIRLAPMGENRRSIVGFYRSRNCLPLVGGARSPLDDFASD